MAYTIEEFSKLDIRSKIGVCSKCGENLADDRQFDYFSVTGRGNLLCNVCYYEELGEIIVQHPIGIPINIKFKK